MTMFPLAFTVAVACLFFGSCAVLLLRYRKGRLAADALQLLERSDPAHLSPTPQVLPFVVPRATLQSFPTVARISGLNLDEAGDLLDWLEHNGYEDRELLCEAESTF